MLSRNFLSDLEQDVHFFGRAAHRIHRPKSTGHLSSVSTNAVRQSARWAGIKSRLLTGLTVVVVVAAASVVAIALFVRPFQGRPSVTTSPTKQQPLSLETTNLAMAVGPAYRGPLGDFFVTGNANEGADFPPCPRPFRPAQNYKASEVYSPIFGDAEVNECANGLIPGISVYGRPSMGKRFFVGPAKVNWVAPLDRLKLLTVAGYPAIAKLPESDEPGELELVVIQRFPGNNKPGIMVWIHRPWLSLEETTALAAKIMGVRP